MKPLGGRHGQLYDIASSISSKLRYQGQGTEERATFLSCTEADHRYSMPAIPSPLLNLALLLTAAALTSHTHAVRLLRGPRPRPNTRTTPWFPAGLLLLHAYCITRTFGPWSLPQPWRQRRSRQSTPPQRRGTPAALQMWTLLTGTAGRWQSCRSSGTPWPETPRDLQGRRVGRRACRDT